MNRKEILKSILLTLASLAGGFAAISLPICIFGSMSTEQVRILFVTELAVYFTVGMVFLLIKDGREQKRKKQRAQHKQRQEKINRVIDEWYNLAA